MLIESIEWMNELPLFFIFSAFFVRWNLIFSSRNASLSPTVIEMVVSDQRSHFTMHSDESNQWLVTCQKSFLFHLTLVVPFLRPQLSLVFIGLNPVTAEPDLHLHCSSLLCYETEVDQLPHVDDKVTPTLWEFEEKNSHINLSVNSQSVPPSSCRDWGSPPIWILLKLSGMNT